jgi:hypothetical protein
MPEQTKGRIEIVVDDEGDDGTLIWATLAKGSFSGSARTYTQLKHLASFASALTGFPANVEARCTYAAGWPEDDYVELALFCLDHAGHAAVSVTIADAPRLKVTVGFAVEAASIDEFRAQLTEICQTGQGKAILLGTLG